MTTEELNGLYERALLLHASLTAALGKLEPDDDDDSTLWHKLYTARGHVVRAVSELSSANPDPLS